MNKERLHDLLDEHLGKFQVITACHDCGSRVKIIVIAKEDGIHITGGALYEPQKDWNFAKCDKCFEKDPVLRNYQDCEVYARVVGYLRPVSQWNEGKVAEFHDRKMADLSLTGVR